LRESPFFIDETPMTPAPTIPEEDARLRALQALNLLDTPPEERFDRVVRFAAEQLDMPIALMTLIDRERQWFKSSRGMKVVQTGRDVSFCGHAIVKSEPFIVEDAQRDARFADNPLVTGDPHVRFYAGAPLRAPDGHRIGTLCVIDTVPRSFGPLELSILEALQALVNDTIAGVEDAQ
jgi:GAF domain-containing protein